MTSRNLAAKRPAPKAPRLPGYYSPDELAALLGVHRKTLQNWRRDGRGPDYIQDGGIVRYPVAAIEKWERERLRATA